MKSNEIEFHFTLKVKVDDYLPVEKMIRKCGKQLNDIITGERIFLYDQNGAEYVSPKN